MRYPLPAIAAGLLLLSATALAQFPFTVRHVATAPVPSALFRDGQGRVHTLAAGVDRNFDGRYQPDSGDVSASWFILDPETDAVLDSMSFGCFFSSFPVRAGVDNEGILYVAQLGRVRAFSLADQSLLRDTVILGEYSGVSWDPIQETLLLHRRPGFTEPGWVVRYSPKNDQVISEYLSAANPQMSVSRLHGATGVPEVYTMAEGAFGSPSSRLSWTSSIEDVVRQRVGASMPSGATDLLFASGRLFLADTRAFRVHVFSVDGLATHPVSPLGIPEADGQPTALALADDNALLVGTGTGGLLRFDLTTGDREADFSFASTVSTIAVEGTTAYVGLAGSGGATSSVAVVDLSSWSWVDTVHVNGAPAQIVVDTAGIVHVFGRNPTSGRGWWTAIDQASRDTVWTRDLPGTVPLTFGVEYDPERHWLFVPIETSVWALHAAIPDNVGVVYSDSARAATRGGRYVAVELSDDAYIVTWRPDDTSFTGGEVHVVDQFTQRLRAVAATGIYPRETAVVTSLRGPDERALAMVTLSDGLSQPASLSYFAYAPDVLPPGDTLGTGANHLLASSDDTTLIVTLNGSHQLAFLNAERWRITHRMDTRTTGYDGPRETAELASSGNRVLATASYDGTLRLSWWDNDTAGARGVVATGGKGESVLFRWFPRFKAYVANAFAPDYTADTTVAIVEIPLGIASERGADAATLGVAHPNPARDRSRVAIRLDAPRHARLELRSIDGALTRVVFDDVLQPGAPELTVPVDDLASGSYLLVLTTGGRVHTTPLQVVR